ncbi:GntR family transcriptional regulator [Spirilliplanes yamanashiensis]|uniref:GntR family transcriptional regulator n=2 Tax=Spirilliplanes yamanashiensis TaxID=42233 RepID=A0A8J4DFQ9_9ACTN|nr:GntR family transcriptional regulator [Spirilliplanes yamanashiensis]
MNAAPEGSTGADFLQLDIGHAPAGGRADWLAGALRQAIGDGRLPVGARLPATRELAGDLGVSRGVVTEAYRRLADEGHIAGRRGRAGTVVVAAPAAAGPTAVSAPAPPPFELADPGTEVFEALRAAPARIDLSPGVPDLAAFPRAAWLRAERAVLGRLTPPDFGYGDASGTPALRVAVAHWLARNRGIAADPADVIVVGGVSQALALIAQVLRSGGVPAVAVEDPGSLGARQQLRDWGMATPSVPVDDEGLVVDALGDHPAVMVTPAHQFPTGVVLSGARRRELARWAAAGGLVVEDDYDAEHRYDRLPVPALKAAMGEHVVYTGSVSKLLAPAMRIGWLLAPRRLHGALAAAKRNADLGNAALPQLVLAELMTSGALDRHLRLMRRRHIRRRDAMIAALAAHLPGAVVHGAAAGLHLMVTFPAGLPGGHADTDLAAAALAAGVRVQPLSWHRRLPGPPGLVLGYAAGSATQTTEGIRTIGAALRRL